MTGAVILLRETWRSERTMLTKSIQLSEEEDAELQQCLAVTGGDEADVLKCAALRGLRELRLEQGIRAFRQGRSSSEAAQIAGLPRAMFLEILMDEGETLLDGPSTLADELGALAERLNRPRLAAVARKLADDEE